MKQNDQIQQPGAQYELERTWSPAFALRVCAAAFAAVAPAAAFAACVASPDFDLPPEPFGGMFIARKA